MRLSSAIWDAMGWCPMHSSVRSPVRGPDTGTARQRDTLDDGSPVARRSSRYMRLAWGVVILAWIIAVLALPYLPEIIPVHWDLHGVADGFVGRLYGALSLPVLLTLVMILLLVLPRFDSMQASLVGFRDIYAIVILSTVAMIFCIELMTLAIAFGIALPVATIISILIGLLFIVMGNLMPHVGRNRTMGIRLPWTLASDEVWKKTHDYAGPLFTGAGAVVVIGSLLAGTWAIALMLVVILGTTLYISIWSYRIAQHIPAGE